MITDELGNPKKYFKKFTSSVLSLEEKYKQALNHLNIIKSQFPVWLKSYSLV